MVERVPLNIDIEYCGVCNLKSQCNSLADHLKTASDNVNVACRLGREGSFEIKINETLVYSKMQTMALPDYDEVFRIVKEASEGAPVRPVKKEQPITCAPS